MVLLTAAARFLHYALANGDLVSPLYFVTNFIILAAIAALAWRVARTGQLASQHPWIYERTSPVSVKQL